jgi:hypothetical protein
MTNKENNEKYKIKVNRITSENERNNHYSNYMSNDYSQIKKRVPNNTILCQLKFKPDIIINEYHQTSNNINTNINIKANLSKNTNQKLNANNNNNNAGYNTQHNNKRILFGNEKNNNVFTNKYNNNSQKIINTKKDNKKNINNNSDIFSPILNKKNANNNRDENYKKRNIHYIEEYKAKDPNKNYYRSPINNKNSNNIQMNSRGFNSNNNNNNRINNLNEKENNNPINNNLNYGRKNNAKSNKDINQQQNIVNDTSSNLCYKTFYNRRNNFSKENNSNIFFNNTNQTRNDSSVESLRDRKMKEMDSIVFASGNYINTIFNKRLKRKSNSSLIGNEYDNNSALSKLKYYRIKLFKEFMKHFEIFYSSYMRKLFLDFFDKIKSYKIHKRRDNNYIYDRKNRLKNNTTIERYGRSQSNLVNNRNDNNNYDGINILEVFKSSTMNDYYKAYNHLKKNRTKFRLFNSSLNELNNLSTSKSNYNINSAPRINKNSDNSSIKRNERNMTLISSNSKSPSFRLGNHTYINNDISFGYEGKNEDELFRNSKELNKKYEQIQRRRKISEIKRIKKHTNKSVDIDNIKMNEMKYLKIDKNLIENPNSNSIGRRNIKIRNKDDQLIKISSYDEDNNNYNGNFSYRNKNNENENIRNRNYNYTRKYYGNTNEKNVNLNQVKSNDDNYYINSNSNINSNININSNDNDKNINTYKKGSVISSLRKNRGRLFPRKEFLNMNVVEKNNNNNIHYGKYYNKNRNEEQNTQLVKDNKTFNNNKNQENELINNNEFFNKCKNNIYYSKNSKINFVPILIKNIITKDKRINITINYYTYLRMHNIIKRRFYHLAKSENISNCYIGVPKRKNNIRNMKLLLSSIKEEDVSNQNSKIYEESGTFGGNNLNLCEIKKSHYIQQKYELKYKQFKDIIEKILINKFMKSFFDKMKSIKGVNKINNNIQNNGYKRIYRKRGITNNNKYSGDTRINRFNKRIGINNNYKNYEDKIKKFRNKLIKFILGIK